MFDREGQSPVSVTPVTVTEKVVWAAIVIGPQLRVLEVTVQLALLSVQVTPAGSESVMTTPVASPSPSLARLIV